MSFIGIVAKKKVFENIKNKMIEEIQDEAISFIHINLRSIENIKNIKFEIIIIEDNIEKFKEYKEILERISTSAQYLIINTDKNLRYKKANKQNNIITYGLNQKATVTISSITANDISIYLQKTLENKEKKPIEIEEQRIGRKEKNGLQIYEILIIYTLFKIFGKNIIYEI